MQNELVHDYNREETQRKYVDSIIAHLDFIQIRELLRDYLHSEKNLYSNEDLYDEIVSRGDECLSDVFGKGYRYSRIIQEEEVLS